MNIFEYARQQRSQNQPQPIEPTQQDVQGTAPIPEKPQRMTIFDYAREKKAQAPQKQEVPASRGTEIAPGARIEGTMPGITEGLRHATRLGSRAAEVIGGAPAALIEAPQQLAIYGAEKIAGKELPYLHEKAKKVIEETGLPTTQSLRKKSEELTGGFTKPQSQAEEDIDEFVQDVTGFALPGVGTKAKVGGKLATAFPKAAKYLKAIGIATTGQTAKAGAKMTGFGQEGQEAAKSGAMFLSSMFNRKGAEQLKRKTYEARDASYPKGQRISSRDLNHELNLIDKKLISGGETPSTREIKGYIKSLKNNFKSGSIEIEQLTDAKKKINEYRKKFIIDKPDRKYFNDVAAAVDNELKKYGQKNPEFYKLHKSGDEMHRAIAEADKIENYFRETVKPLIKTKPGAAVIPAILGGISYAPLKSVELFQRIRKSPKLMNFYTQAIMHASKENASAAARDIERLNHELSKEHKKTEEIDLSKYR